MIQTDTTPSAKTKAMHEVLRQIPYNLFAIGIGTQDESSTAFLASWVTQCSFEPPHIAIAVRKGTHSHNLAESKQPFTVNLLAKTQTDLARILVKPHDRDAEKLHHIPIHNGKNGAPVIENSLGHLECSYVSSADAGDHTLFIGEITEAQQNATDEPLTCSDIGWNYAG